MNDTKDLSSIIRNRRSIKPGDLNGEKIDNEIIKQLLQLADWAPTHARTEPWRFIVYEGEAMHQFSRDHAELYRQHTSAEKFTEAKCEKMKEQCAVVSHLIIVYMKRTINNSIPVVEEIAAVAAAIQNMLLAISDRGLAALWSTGGMTHHASMKQYLGLHDEDIVMGLIYVGKTSKEPPVGKRSIAIEDKIVWKS